MWAKIVLNLLSNALKFTFEGGDRGALRAARRRRRADGRRHRHRHRPGRPGAALRALPPRRRRALAQPRGHRASGWRSSPSSPSCTAARSAVRAAPGRGLDASRVTLPFGARAPAGRAGRQRARRAPTAPALRRGLRRRGAALAGPGEDDAAARRRARRRPPARARRRRQRRHARLHRRRCWPAATRCRPRRDGAVALELARARPARPRPHRRDDAQPRRLRAARAGCRPTRRRPTSR